MVICHKYRIDVENLILVIYTCTCQVEVVHRDPCRFVSIIECVYVSFSVLAELSLEEDEVEGRRSDHKEDVQEGKTVFVRSVVVCKNQKRER